MDLSSVTELAPLAEVARDVVRAAELAEARIFAAGAFARDLWLWHAYGIETGRATADLDVAVQCESWEHFDRISELLLTEAFRRTDEKVRHRFRHRGGTEIDLVPFGELERADRTIAWPPEEDRAMRLLGFREALDSAVIFQLPEGVVVPVISLESLAALKLFAWQERRILAPRKDAADLDVILRNYAEVGNRERMFEEIPGLAAREDFDLERAGAELLGRDLARSVGRELIAALRLLLEQESNPEGDLRLAREMSGGDEEAARLLLVALLRGLASREGGSVGMS